MGIFKVCIFLISLSASATCDKSLGGQSQDLPKITPVTLKPLDRLVDDPNFQFEMKYDGFRSIAGLGASLILRKVDRPGWSLATEISFPSFNH
jgi:hypothetical protein